MADDLAGAHAAGIHRDNLVVEPREAALVLGDQLRIKAGLAVTRNLQLDLAGVGNDRLLAIPISPIARLFAGEIMIHLSVENPFRQGLLQGIEQPIRVENRLRVGVSQQLVEDSVRNTRFFAAWHRRAPLLRSCPTPHEIPDSPSSSRLHARQCRAPRPCSPAGAMSSGHDPWAAWSTPARSAWLPSRRRKSQPPAASCGACGSAPLRSPLPPVACAPGRSSTHWCPRP